VGRQFPNPNRLLLESNGTLAAHLRLQALFAVWLDAFAQAALKHGIVPMRVGKIDPRILRAAKAIDSHNLNTPFSESVVAEQVDLSVSQLNRLFYKQFNVSSRGYYERRRTERALAWLQGSSRSIKEIAFDLGFSSLPHFCAWAKNRLGDTASKVRTAGANSKNL
jgi:AraC-like DNA-binding protein